MKMMQGVQNFLSKKVSFELEAVWCSASSSEFAHPRQDLQSWPKTDH